MWCLGVGLSCLCVCVCVYEHCVCSAHGGHRRVLESLELESQKDVGLGTYAN